MPQELHSDTTPDTRKSQTLFIDRFSSSCGNCNRGAVPDQRTHDKCYGYGEQPEGCGVEFKYVTSNYIGFEEGIAKMRPDLEFIPVAELYGA